MTGNKKKIDENLIKLREFASQYSNKHCFECNQKGPTYVNMTVGAFICTKCSGLLRGLNPPHRVKSISMATFAQSEIEFLEARGNLHCQRIWLGLFDPKSHEDVFGGVGNDAGIKDEHKMKDFLIDKYEKKIWYVTPQEVEQQVAREKEIMQQQQRSSSSTAALNGKKEKSDSFSSAKSSGESSYSSALNNINNDPFSIGHETAQPQRISNGLGKYNSCLEDILTTTRGRNSPNFSSFDSRQDCSKAGSGGSLVRRRSGNVTHSLSSSPKILNAPFALKPPAPSSKKKVSSDSISLGSVDAFAASRYPSMPSHPVTVDLNGVSNRYGATPPQAWLESHQKAGHNSAPSNPTAPHENGAPGKVESGGPLLNGFEDSFSSISHPLPSQPSSASNLGNVSSLLPKPEHGPSVHYNGLIQGPEPPSLEDKYKALAELDNAYHASLLVAQSTNNNTTTNLVAPPPSIGFHPHPNTPKQPYYPDECKNPFASPPIGRSQQQHNLSSLTHKQLSGAELTFGNLIIPNSSTTAFLDPWHNLVDSSNASVPTLNGLFSQSSIYPNCSSTYVPGSESSYGGHSFNMAIHKQAAPNPFMPPQLQTVNMNVSSIATNPFL